MLESAAQPNRKFSTKAVSLALAAALSSLLALPRAGADISPSLGTTRNAVADRVVLLSSETDPVLVRLRASLERVVAGLERPMKDAGAEMAAGQKAFGKLRALLPEDGALATTMLLDALKLRAAVTSPLSGLAVAASYTPENRFLPGVERAMERAASFGALIPDAGDPAAIAKSSLKAWKSLPAVRKALDRAWKPCPGEAIGAGDDVFVSAADDNPMQSNSVDYPFDRVSIRIVEGAADGWRTRIRLWRCHDGVVDLLDLRVKAGTVPGTYDNGDAVSAVIVTGNAGDWMTGTAAFGAPTSTVNFLAGDEATGAWWFNFDARLPDGRRMHGGFVLNDGNLL